MGVEVGTAARRGAADMPYKAHVQRIVHDLFARGLLVLALGVGGWPAVSAAADEAAPAAAHKRVLRYAFSVAETGFDPARISDLYSRIVTAHIFESPLAYDHLARPYKLRPRTASEMPEISDDFRTFVFKIRPGIYFADDPVFKGQRRELTAQDYVYTIKRHYDPTVQSPGQSILEDEGIIGLRELREAALKTKKPFDYDGEVEGLKAIDRHTLRVRLRESRPRHLYSWAAPDVFGAVAREVVEAYGDKIMDHPVGTGPFRLVEWRRSSRMVLERNPNFREITYEAEPNADDADGQALVARMKGRRLPILDRVEIAVIEEAQPRWLAFLNHEQNFLFNLSNEFVSQAIPGNKLAPSLAKRGIRAYQVPGADVTLTVFNMEDPLVGGYTPEKVALRRAMVLGNNVDREIQIVRRNQAIRAQSLMPPMTAGYRADLRTEMGTYSLARAKALLDLYGWVDRDGDGWRETPAGEPLVLVMNTQSDQVTRQTDQLWKKDMDALGLRVALKTQQWPENLKQVRSGKFMLWRVGSTAATPDGQGALERIYGGSVGKGNISRFKLPALDKVYDDMRLLPDGPERQKLFDEATKLLVAYAPYRVSVHRLLTDLGYPEVVGFRRPPFWLNWWEYMDVEPGVPAQP